MAQMTVKLTTDELARLVIYFLIYFDQRVFAGSSIQEALLRDNPDLGIKGSPSFPLTTSVPDKSTGIYGILIPDATPFPADGVLYNVSYYAPSNQGVARIILLQPDKTNPHKFYTRYHSEPTESVQREASPGGQVWFHLQAKRHMSQTEESYFRVKAGDVVGLQFANGFTGHYQTNPDCSTSDRTYIYNTPTSEQGYYVEIYAITAHTSTCREYAYTVAYVANGHCLNYTSGYKFADCLDEEGNQGYGICEVESIAIQHTGYIGDEFCFNITAEPRRVDEKEEVVHFTLDEYRIGTYSDYHKAARCQEVSGSGVNLTDGGMNWDMFELCFTTPIEWDPILTKSNSLLVNFKPGTSAESLSFTVKASTSDKAQEGYYEFLKEKNEADYFSYQGLVGAAGVVIAVTIMAVIINRKHICKHKNKQCPMRDTRAQTDTAAAARGRESALPAGRTRDTGATPHAARGRAGIQSGREPAYVPAEPVTEGPWGGLTGGEPPERPGTALSVAGVVPTMSRTTAGDEPGTGDRRPLSPGAPPSYEEAMRTTFHRDNKWAGAIPSPPDYQSDA